MTPGEIVHHNSVVASLNEFAEKHHNSALNQFRIMTAIQVVLSVANIVFFFLHK